MIATDETGATIEWVWQSGVVVGMDRAFAQGHSRGEPRLFAIDPATPAVAWSGVIDEPVLSSWSAPVIDRSNETVVGASGRELRAFDALSGASRWTVLLENPVVNASPLVTDDMGGADRLFVTDSSTFGDGRLYCVNVDPRSPANPFDPGEIVWSVILGDTNGNTPAYLDGVVYVATSEGAVLAFDAGASATPAPLWTFEDPSAGFFGGCSVYRDGAGVSVLAATYGFSGGHLNSHLIKLDGATGEELWRVPCNRTDATPIPLVDGRVVLSAGISGFGSQPSVQLFREIAGGAELVWDTALDTWDDVNGNQRMDPGEFLLVGGWTHQPVVTGATGAAGTAGRERLIAGAIPAGSLFGPSTDVYVLDLARVPGEPGFVVSHFAGAGGTPALTTSALLTIGAGGLHAFDVCYADCDQAPGLGVLDIFDFLCFQDRFVNADPYACDCDVSGGSGVCDIFDFLCFQDRFAAGCQ